MIWRCILAVLVLAPWAPGGVRAQDGAPESLVAQGDSAVARFDNAEAVRLFEAAIDRIGGTVPFGLLARLSRTHNDYGMDLVAEGREREGEEELDVALKYAERLTERFPDRAESWFLLSAAYGNLALFKGGGEKVRIGRAVEEYSREAINVNPGFAPPYAVLGIFYREVAELSWVQRTLARTLFGGLPDGSLEESEAMLRAAIERQPELPIANFELGRTLLAMGRRDEAETYLRRAISLEPLSTKDIRNAEEARRMLGE